MIRTAKTQVDPNARIKFFQKLAKDGLTDHDIALQAVHRGFYSVKTKITDIKRRIATLRAFGKL